MGRVGETSKLPEITTGGLSTSFDKKGCFFAGLCRVTLKFGYKFVTVAYFYATKGPFRGDI